MNIRKTSHGVSSDAARQPDQAPGPGVRAPWWLSNTGTACAARQSIGLRSSHFVRCEGETANILIGHGTTRRGGGEFRSRPAAVRLGPRPASAARWLGPGARDRLRRSVLQYGDIDRNALGGRSAGPLAIVSDRNLQCAWPILRRARHMGPDPGIAYRTRSCSSRAYCRRQGAITDDELRRRARAPAFSEYGWCLSDLAG